MIVKRKHCILCGNCAEACPVDAIYLDASNEPFVCLHCGQCVEFCPHGCLELAEVPIESTTDEAARGVAS